MQKLHAKIDSLLLQQKQARRLREKDMQERFKKMGEELRGTTKAGDYVAGSPTGVNEYCGSPNYDSC